MTTDLSSKYSGLFDAAELTRPDVLANKAYLQTLQAEVRKSPVFDHPFLIRLSQGAFGEAGVKFALIQFSKHVRVFTAFLGHLLGVAPEIRDRILLFDNLNEEMGRGNLGDTHYMLYLKMMASIGVTLEEIDRTPMLSSVELLNDALGHAIQRSFVTALSWLGLGGELTIPNNFPYLALGIRRAFPRADLAFFERHGAPDEEHNDDSNLLLALHLKSDADRTRVKVEAAKSLFLRNAVWSELAQTVTVSPTDKR